MDFIYKNIICDEIKQKCWTIAFCFELFLIIVMHYKFLPFKITSKHIKKRIRQYTIVSTLET